MPAVFMMTLIGSGIDGGRRTRGLQVRERNQVAVVALVAVDLDVEVVQVPHELRVDALHVVALVERVDRGLPVAVPLDGDVARERHLRKVVRVEVQRHRARGNRATGRRRGSRLNHTKPPHVSHGTSTRPRQGGAPCGKVSRSGMRLNAPSNVVFPMVVLALERIRAAEPWGPQAVAAMQADVVEPAHACRRCCRTSSTDSRPISVEM